MLLELVYMYNDRYLIILLILFRTLITRLYSLRLLYYILWVGENNIMLVKFHEESKMKISIIFLGLIVIFMGSILSWVIFSNVTVIWLMFRIKIMNLILIMVGFLIFLFKNYSILE